MKVVVWKISEIGEECKHVGSLLYDDVVRACTFSPSQQLLAVGDESRKISMLIVNKDFQLGCELPCPAGVRSLSFSQDSRFLASAGEDMQVSVWDLIKETVLFQLPKAKDWYCGVAFSPLNNWLATCGYGDSKITLFVIEGGTGELELQNKVMSDDDDDDDDDEAVVAPAVATVQIGAVAAPAGVQVSVPVHAGAGLAMPSTGPLISAGTCKFAVPQAGAGAPAVPALGSPAPGAASLNGPASSGLAVPARSKERKPSIVTLGAGLFQIAVTKEKGRSSIGGVDKTHLPHIMKELHGDELAGTYLDVSDPSKRERYTLLHKDELAALAFSADGCTVVSGGEDRDVILWNIHDKTRLMEFKMAHPIKCVAYAPDDKYVAAGDEDGTVVVWDPTSKAEVGTAQIDGIVMSLAMNAGPDFLAVGTSEKVVSLFALPSFEEISVLHHDGDVRSLSFSPDGKMLAGGGGTDMMHGLMTNKSADHKMKTVVWEVDSCGDNCKHLGTILSDDIVHAVAFSPSGELLATGGEGRLISLLQVKTGFAKVGDLMCPAGVRSISWSPDSHFLASAGEDMQISVWDLLTEQVIFQLPKAKDWLCAVAFSPAKVKNLWIAACGFGCNELALYPVETCLFSDIPDGAPKRRNSLGKVR